MSILRKLLIISFLLVSTLYCASVKRYFINRGNDLKDIPIIGFEKNVYGIIFETVPISAMPIGYQNASSGVGWGLINGHLGAYRTGDDENSILIYDMEGEGKSKREMEIYFGNTNLITTAYYYKPLDDSKNIRVWQKHSKRIIFNNRFCYDSTRVIYKNKSIPKGSLCTFYSSFDLLRLEFSVGLYFGIHLGISGGELFDFFMGILGLDPEHDDISDVDSNISKFPNPILQLEDWDAKMNALDKKMDKRLKQK